MSERGEYVYGTDGNEGHWLTGEQIVRCRDCGYIMRTICSDGKERTYCAHFVHRMRHLDGFCSWGKRKEGK